MIQPDERILGALTALQSDPNFKMFFEWLDRSAHAQAHSSTMVREDVDCRWMQGRTQELRELCKFIVFAKEDLEKVRRAKEQAKQVNNAGGI